MNAVEQPTIDYSGAIEFEALNQSSGEKFILFELGGRVCGVPAASVLEVAHSLQVSTIPNSPGWLLGLSIFRGAPVAMVQPHAVIKGAAILEATRNFKTIIFRSRDDEVQLALPVDRINEMITFPEKSHPGSGGSHTDRAGRNDAPIFFVDPYRFIDELEEGGR